MSKEKAFGSKQHWEKSQKQNPTSDLKYADFGMDNAKELDQKAQGLATYVKKNRNKN